jgi:hypothetical protein
MLDQTSALLASIPQDKIASLLDESAKGLNDAGFDLGSLVDSASVVARDSRSVVGELRALITDSGPLLDGQAEAEQDTRTWTRSLANVTDQLVTNDAQVRTILDSTPAALEQVSQLLTDAKPTLPLLLANLTSLGQVAMTYHPSLEQLLVLMPSFFADFHGVSPWNNPTGLPLGNFRIQLNDPPACTVGFLPPSQWRSPADTTTMDTPDGLYCKLPQDSPLAVRGARNLPCMARPGKRAPTVEICDSDEPYEPLAMRQHALGPSPFDPNLISQGLAPDDRVDADERLFAPIEGTPLPPGVPPPAGGPPPPAPPPVGVTTYDPRTGRYMAPDGTMHEQSTLVPAQRPDNWQELLLPPEAP